MISTWSRGPADHGMPDAILLANMERVRTHPWWQARASFAVGLLAKHGVSPPARVAEAGCGWGTNLDRLEQCGYRATGIDVSRRTLERIDKPGRNLVEADFDQEFPAEARASYDACLVLDVIEHLEDDRSALGRIGSLLVPGGVCIVSVPALPRLFSDFDRIQGHRRRYLPESLQAAFANTGLGLKSIFWWGFWMLPILQWMRLKTGQQPHTESRDYADYLRLPRWPGRHLMDLAFALERPFAMNGWLPKGTSLFAVARRLE